MLDHRPKLPFIDNRPATYLVVGYGWRAPFFLKPSQLFPDHFRATGVVVRSDERAAQAQAEFGLPSWRTLEEAVAADRPDFVVLSVPWPVSPTLTRRVVAMGLPVLCETPPAPTLDQMMILWDDVGASGLVQVAEQYPLYPTHVARKALCEQGLIGSINEISTSQTHQYHAMALIRHFLDSGFEEALVHATSSVHPLANPLTPKGWTDNQSEVETRNVRGTIQFEGGTTGYYDFTDNQWWNPLRGDLTTIRGSRGEIVEDRVTWLAGEREILTSDLERRQTGHGLNLEGNDLSLINFGEKILYKNTWLPGRLADDEIAVTELLARMGAWVRNEGPAPYPLADGCQDWALALAMDESIARGTAVPVARLPWQHQRRRPE